MEEQVSEGASGCPVPNQQYVKPGMAEPFPAKGQKRLFTLLMTILS
jgi:hypothetical protein